MLASPTPAVSPTPEFRSSYKTHRPPVGKGGEAAPRPPSSWSCHPAPIKSPLPAKKNSLTPAALRVKGGEGPQLAKMGAERCGVALVGTAVHHRASAPPSKNARLADRPPRPPTSAHHSATPPSAPPHHRVVPRGFTGIPRPRRQWGWLSRSHSPPAVSPLQAPPPLAEGVSSGFSPHSSRPPHISPSSPRRGRSDPEEFTYLQPLPGSGPSAASRSACCGACA